MSKHVKKVLGRVRDPSCVRCDWYLEGDTGNVCHLHGVGYFNVDKARAIIRRKRRRALTITAAALNSTILRRDRNRLHEPHLAHVNPRKFGIVGVYHGKDGKLVSFILEGNHRAERAARAGRPFKAYPLSIEESQSIFRKRPPRGMTFVYK